MGSHERSWLINGKKKNMLGLLFVCGAEDGQALGDDTADVEQDVLELLGFDEWEGVAVGFLLAKVLEALRGCIMS